MSRPGTTLSEYFTLDHRSCDSQWTEVENAVEQGDTDAAMRLWRRFDANLRQHLEMEEQILFPAFEQQTGMTGGGPTFVMRSEHEQMRGLLGQMAEAAARGDSQELLDQGDTLLMLIAQHNQKEEGMLYPMAEQALDAEWSDLRARLEGFEPAP
jgi:hemerythrin-like domain-containing protein